MLKQPKIWLPVIGAGATLAFIGGALLSTQVKPGSNPGNLFSNVSGSVSGAIASAPPAPISVL
ncbi:MAG: hypothetical protein HC860_21545 [Alkalinema sp. RU_4_3]|nr:hypothetical protein [Alkalinema sp. RU_4_3]